MNKKIGKFFLILSSLLITLLLTGCQAVLLNPKGIIAADEKHILIISVLLMLLIVVPVIVLILWFAWRYRESNAAATYAPEWAHSTWLEAVCWTVPCVIIGILGFITWVSTHRLDPYRPLDAKGKVVTIQAISLEWKWLFIYPDENIATLNYVQLPVGVPVRFLISAEGPMNSIQIPHLGGQIYAMAGMKTQLHLLASEPGIYPGLSTNFTGDGFSDMHFTVKASSMDEYKQWVQTVKESQENLTLAYYKQLIKPSKNEAVKYFSAADKVLFHQVVMKSMMPLE